MYCPHFFFVPISITVPKLQQQQKKTIKCGCKKCLIHLAIIFSGKDHGMSIRGKI